ncbi:MAG: hypothetical protein HGA72_02105 [Chlorobiaceae bacterium]|nr:hypothetical protein [Chlorobiaceae bacterium]
MGWLCFISIKVAAGIGKKGISLQTMVLIDGVPEDTIKIRQTNKGGA